MFKKIIQKILKISRESANIDIVLENIKGNESILDFACGNCYILGRILKKYPKLRAAAYDIDRERIRDAENTFQNKNYQIDFYDDLELLKNNYGNFDIILIISVLYLMPFSKQEEILKLLIDKLNPGGKIIIQEAFKKRNFKHLLTISKEMILKKLAVTKAESRELYFRSLDDWKNLFEKLNLKFEIIEQKFYRVNSVFFICRRY